MQVRLYNTLYIHRVFSCGYIQVLLGKSGRVRGVSQTLFYDPLFYDVDIFYRFRQLLK